MPQAPPRQDWFPHLRDKLGEDGDFALRNVYQNVYSLRDQLNQVQAQMKAQPNFSLQQIQDNLQFNGTNPLNLTGLVGLSATVQPSVIEDSHGNRVKYPPAEYQRVLYFEVDRFVFYLSVLSSGNWQWLYATGQMNDTSTTLAALPGDLAQFDQGFLFRSEQFDRVWRWTGTVWHYNDGSLGAGAVVATNGPQPSGGYWQTCDGSSVACALDDATISNISAGGPTLPNGLSWWMRR